MVAWRIEALGEGRETELGDKARRPRGVRPRVFAAMALLAACWASAAWGAEAWYPVTVDVWSPPFNSEHKRITKPFTPPEAAAKPWRICAAIPHLKDDYWLAVNFGLVDEARRLGVSLNLYEAGGYEHLDVQRKQIEDCLANGAQALVIGAVSATGLNDLVEKAVDAGVPFVDMINGVSSEKISARVAADFYDMGFAAGAYVKSLPTAEGRPLKVAWFPGPSGAGWVADGDRGFRAALAGSGTSVIDGGFGDTGLKAQAQLVQAALAADPDIDVIAGTAVTAEAAIQILQKQNLADRIKVVAYYFGPALSRAIKRGLALAAPSDRQAILARIAMDQAVNLLEGREIDRHIAATIAVVDSASIESFDLTSSIAPVGFHPLFSVGP
jgi:protein TorT